MNSLLVQIEKNVRLYGIDAVVDLITECMANNWKGIIWEKIKKEDKLPSWFNNEPKRKEISDERKKLAEQLTNGTWKP